MRIEKDSLGEVQVPDDALYGAQTQRARDNFPVSGRTLPAAFTRALGPRAALRGDPACQEAGRKLMEDPELRVSDNSKGSPRP